VEGASRGWDFSHVELWELLDGFALVTGRLYDRQTRVRKIRIRVIMMAMMMPISVADRFNGTDEEPVKPNLLLTYI